MGPPPVPKASRKSPELPPASPALKSPSPEDFPSPVPESPSPGKKHGFVRGAVVRILSNGECRGMTGGLGDYDETSDKWEVSGDFGKKWFESSSLAFFVAKRPGQVTMED
ncbi:unnamed protein product [Effrenium voratum]|uniref:Uncharacterized protein n=1 Tax=Effrenium voratum TaxID=2562239 RepID=A0AA36I6D9_9DINO|nr:unnamed protein product [Effrenium voratum]